MLTPDQEHQRYLAETQKLCQQQLDDLNKRAIVILQQSGNSAITDIFNTAIKGAYASRDDLIKRIQDEKREKADEPKWLERWIKIIMMGAKLSFNATFYEGKIINIWNQNKIDTRGIVQNLKDIFSALYAEVEAVAKVK